MNKRIVVTLVAAAVAAVSLAGCSSAATSSGSSGSSGSSVSTPAAVSTPASTSGASSGAAALTTATSPLGDIITDAKGFTVYIFTSDTPNSGSSTCYDECAAAWPAVAADSTSVADGITGKIGSITRTDGTTQLTVDGWPIYRFAKDTAPGQVNGQGVKSVWYALSPDGTADMAAAPASTPAS